MSEILDNNYDGFIPITKMHYTQQTAKKRGVRPTPLYSRRDIIEELGITIRKFEYYAKSRQINVEPDGFIPNGKSNKAQYTKPTFERICKQLREAIIELHS